MDAWVIGLQQKMLVAIKGCRALRQTMLGNDFCRMQIKLYHIGDKPYSQCHVLASSAESKSVANLVLLSYTKVQNPGNWTT